jgi:putative FmdB family regulatory protein
VPTYQYACTECGGHLEAVQKFTDEALTVHEDCGGRLRKVFSPVGIVFKGSGFYRTDSRGSGSPSGTAAASPAASKDSGSTSAGSADSSSSGSSAGSSSASGGEKAATAPASSSASSSSGEKVA